MSRKGNKDGSDNELMLDFGPDLDRAVEVDEPRPEGCWERTKASAKLQYRLCKENASIWVVPLLVFCALCGAGLAVVFSASTSQDNAARQEALALAEETGQWFSDQLDQAILPLFSLAQFVSELDIFQDLPYQIGPAFEPGSLPFLPGDPPTHRNVTGVCDEPAVLQRFTEIASTIKRNAKMEGVLVNLQLAPQAVVCLLHPLNNTEDFPKGVFMDNSGAVGHDLLTDPERKFIAEATIPSDDVVIAGPLTLRQCKECDPTVEKAFIARLAITMEGHEIEVDGKVYGRWGFAVAIINWLALIERSNIYEIFQNEGMEFQLTRTDRSRDGDHVVEKVVVLAETPGFGAYGANKVTTALETTNNEWEMTVGYPADSNARWKALSYVATVGVSFCIAVLVYIVLLQKQIHTDTMAAQSALLVENARKGAIAERELNDYIAHEVRNPLSAAMSACTFVSSAVHEADPLVTEEARQSVRDDVGIIDASLRFINELLRSMLDIHRAANKQMTFDLTKVSILHDIFEPVAAMLYRRDEAFEVVIDCSAHLTVMADRLRLQQVVLNLCRNAAKFVEHGFVRMRAAVVDERVCLYIEDSGPGIPESKRRNLFCRFQESLDSLNQGTGVGLNLCKNLVDLMEGEIYHDESFQSGIEGCPGTRIVVNLKTPPEPIEKSETVLTEQTETDEEMGISKKENSLNLPEVLSILFVDDDRIVRKLAARSINKLMPRWTIREAASGETALQLLQTESFDLIFMDQYMTSAETGLKGTETVRALRAKGVTSTICGLSANDLEKAFYSAGADAFCFKPFPCKEDELRRELARILLAEESTNFTASTLDSSMGTIGHG